MGMTPQFPLSYKEVEQHIKQYKQDLAENRIEKADFWDFCGRLGVSDEEVIQVIKEPNKKNEDLSLLLKKYLTWQKGQYLAGKGWGGPNSSKAIFALKQSLGGYQFTDVQEQKNTGELKIRLDFGGKKDSFK